MRRMEPFPCQASEIALGLMTGAYITTDDGHTAQIGTDPINGGLDRAGVDDGVRHVMTSCGSVPQPEGNTKK